MTAPGWLFMLLSWGFILGLFVFCMKHALQPPKQTDKENSDERK